MSETRLVTVTELTVNVDDRGELYEVLRRDAPEFVEFGQAYIVRSRQPGTVRAWHRHAVMWDAFCIVAGSALFQFVDDVPGGPSADGYPAERGRPYRITASDRKPVVLHVPPGVWHGWASLEPNTLLLSIATQPYNAEEPDEERRAADWFGADWQVQAR